MSEGSFFFFKSPSEIKDRLDISHYKPSIKGKSNFEKTTKFKVLNLGSEDILEYIAGGTTPKNLPIGNEDKEKLVIFLKNENIKKNFLDLKNTYYIFKQDFKKKLKKVHVRKGDILLSMTGTLGNACLIRENIEASINQNIVILRFNKYEVDMEYMVYYLNSEFVKNQIHSLFTSAQTPYLNMSKIKSLKIILPPLTKQKEISNDIIIIKKQIEENEKKIQEINSILSNVILEKLNIKLKNPKKELFYFIYLNEKEDRLDFKFNNPKFEVIKNLKRYTNYEVSPIIDLLRSKITKGITPPNYSFPLEGVPFLGAGNVYNGRVHLNDCTYIDKEIHNTTLNNSKINKGDVLVTMAGTIGRCGLYEENIESNINQAIARLQVNEKINPKYLIFYLNSMLGQLQFDRNKTDVGQPNINFTEIGKIEVIAPPREMQIKIIDDIVQIEKSLREHEEKLKSSKEYMVNSFKGAIA